MVKLVDEFNAASKLAMVAQAKLGQEQQKAAEDCKKLLAAQDQMARKEEEVARMLADIASMKLNVGKLHRTYQTQQLQVQKAVTELYTADSVVRGKMVSLNSCLLGGPRMFGEGGNDVRVKADLKKAGEAALKEAEELLKEQQKAAKVAAEKATAAKVAAQNAANAAVAAEKEQQRVAKLRSQVAALPERNVVQTAPVNAVVAAPENVVVTAPDPRTTGARRKETAVSRPLSTRAARDTANKGNRVWPDDINLPVRICLVKVVEDQIPGSREQYK